MVTLEFHDPSGTIEVKQPHAPRIDGERVLALAISASLNMPIPDAKFGVFRM